jgi:hypothetical protein
MIALFGTFTDHMSAEHRESEFRDAVGAICRRHGRGTSG